MIIKYFEINKIKLDLNKFILFYGKNEGLKNQAVNSLTKKSEIFGKFRSGGLSSRIRYIDFLKECNLIRLNNGQNFFVVYLIFLARLFRNIKKIFV